MQTVKLVYWNRPAMTFIRDEFKLINESKMRVTTENIYNLDTRQKDKFIIYYQGDNNSDISCKEFIGEIYNIINHNQDTMDLVIRVDEILEKHNVLIDVSTLLITMKEKFLLRLMVLPRQSGITTAIMGQFKNIVVNRYQVAAKWQNPYTKCVSDIETHNEITNNESSCAMDNCLIFFNKDKTRKKHKETIDDLFMLLGDQATTPKNGIYVKHGTYSFLIRLFQRDMDINMYYTM